MATNITNPTNPTTQRNPYTMTYLRHGTTTAMTNVGDFASSTMRGIKDAAVVTAFDSGHPISNDSDLSGAMRSGYGDVHVAKMNRCRYLILIIGLIITFILCILGIGFGFYDHYSCYQRVNKYTEVVIQNITLINSPPVYYSANIFCELNNSYFVMIITNESIYYTKNNGTKNMSCALNRTSSLPPITITPQPTFTPSKNVIEDVSNFAEICGNKSSVLLLIISFLLIFFSIYIFSVVGELRHRQVFDNRRQQIAREDEVKLNIV
jgi:hypothetical protein